MLSYEKLLASWNFVRGLSQSGVHCTGALVGPPWKGPVQKELRSSKGMPNSVVGVPQKTPLGRSTLSQSFSSGSDAFGGGLCCTVGRENLPVASSMRKAPKYVASGSKQGLNAGDFVGTAGDLVGAAVGAAVGLAVGRRVGASVGGAGRVGAAGSGSRVGATGPTGTMGASVGGSTGAGVGGGRSVGLGVGLVVGEAVGLRVGLTVG